MAFQLEGDIEIIRTSPKSFVVMNPRTGGSFVCGPADRQLLSLLNGARGSAQIQQDFAKKFGRDISQRHVEEFLEQLRTYDLIRDAAHPGRERKRPAEEPSIAFGASIESQPKSAVRLNRRFDLLLVLFGWLLHPIWMIPLSALLLIGLTAVIRGFDRYLNELSTVFLNIPTLILIPLSLAQTLVFMNLPRELVVGMACRRFGVWIRRFGLSWANDTLPFFTCDRGDSSGLLSERARWTILLAGWWSQMAIGALAAIGWSMTPSGSGIGVFCLLLILPWLIGLFLHFNVLTRLDGYKVLSVLTREPRLQERSVAETQAWLRRKTSPEPLTDRERYWFRIYGLCWYAWNWFLRLLYIVGGTYWLIVRLEGLGALLAILSMMVWYRQPMRRFLMERTGTEWMFRKGGNALLRWSIRLVIAAGFIFVGRLPYDRTVTGQCRVVPLGEAGIRAQIADEIVKIHVEESQWVEAGAAIATLSGRDVLRELDQREAEVREAQAQYDQLLAGPREEELAMAEQEVELWRIRRDYSASEVQRLKKLEESGAVDPEELREAMKEKDSSEQLFLTAQEKRARINEGAREEEKRAAQARLEAAQSRLAQADAKKELLTITSPIAGRIVTPYVKLREGQMTQPGDLIATVQDTSRVRVEIAADESAAAARPGMPVDIRLTGLDGDLIAGKVHSIATAAFSESQLRVERFRSDREALIEEGSERETDDYHIRVYVDLTASDATLVPGMTGQARIVTGPDRFWRAVVRPVVRYFRTEVWSWMP